ncbi:MAG: hypothetical protein DRN27_00270 [Thermoplasmata archaeon]|nr:MAG: hypothetical protein DRN27_00270 [Thermoplasmata archaeon]
MTDEKITADMNIKEVIEKYPEVVSVFSKYSMGCVGCIAASFEKLKDIAAVHGTDVDSFVKDLNEAIQS